MITTISRHYRVAYDVAAEHYINNATVMKCHLQRVFNNCVLHDNNVFKPLIELISNSSQHRNSNDQILYDHEIEHGSFTPLVFSTSGGMGKCTRD